MIDYKKFVENSRKWLEDYITSNHLQSLVIGVSGGIDSTVTCAIASPVCHDLGIPLIGRSLPTTTNMPEENNAAILVGMAFCSDFKVENISEECQKLIYELELKEGNMTRLQEGNIKARVRMTYLYHLASIHRGCVLDTDNKTEHELGFWTIHGDVGDLNCGLIHLWKTEVYELAGYLYSERLKFPDKNKLNALLKSAELMPTDGNGVMAGGDCAQFGLDNYEQVDDVLKFIYHRENNMEESIHPLYENDEYIRLIDSYNEQGVDKVITLHQNTMFKRMHLPVYPELNNLV